MILHGACGEAVAEKIVAGSGYGDIASIKIDLTNNQAHYSNDDIGEIYVSEGNSIEKKIDLGRFGNLIKGIVPESSWPLRANPLSGGEGALLTINDVMNDIKKRELSRWLNTNQPKNPYPSHVPAHAMWVEKQRKLASGEIERDRQVGSGLSEEETMNAHLDNNATGGSCPPGKRQYQKTVLFGLIKGQKLCLSDYEAESLSSQQRRDVQSTLNNIETQRKLDNIEANSFRPNLVTCNSSGFGSYVSVNCY